MLQSPRFLSRIQAPFRESRRCDALFWSLSADVVTIVTCEGGWKGDLVERKVCEVRFDVDVGEDAKEGKTESKVKQSSKSVFVWGGGEKRKAKMGKKCSLSTSISSRGEADNRIKFKQNTAC